MTSKVLHVVNIAFVLPYYIGAQFDYFRKKGLEQHIVCSPSDFLDEYAQSIQIPHQAVPILRSINPIADLKCTWQVMRYIKANKIDTVIGHTPKGALIAMMAAYFSGVKTRVYFRHGLMFETSKGLKRKILVTVEKFTAGLATTVVNVSPSVVKKSVAMHLNKPDKNIILNKGTCNGIDIERFNPAQNLDSTLLQLRHQHQITNQDIVIGYVGRLVNDKGINELIAAWKILLTQHKNIKLLLVGPYEERDAIGAEVKAYIEQEPSIIHTGLTNEVTPFYRLMNLFILPSYREGFPTVVLEASAMKLPIITTKATGCVDAIIENETGIFSELNGESIAKSINYYLTQPDKAKVHGEAGRNFVLQNFDQQVIWQAIAQHIYKLPTP
jgi:glycosyltransferase involved in cell wall biosynthesis